MATSGFRHVQSTACILLICPDCGHENAEYADVLRGANVYYCRGEACDYFFDLAPGQRADFGKGFIDACKRFYAAFYAVRGQSAR